MKDIKGIIVPILTPMQADESVNFAQLRVQIDRLIAAGAHGIFCFGTNGEGYILTDEEKEAVLEATVAHVNGRVPVYAGTGCVGTRATIRLSLLAKAIGADYLSVITPWFAAASQQDLYEHYRAVAEATELPMILYNIPARTGNALAPETVAKLSEIDTIVGVKDSSGNFDNLLAYLEQTKARKDFRVLSGNDALTLPTLEAGGAGGIAGCANVFPENMVGIYEAFMAGDLQKARRCQEAIADFRACFHYGNPNTIVKTAVSLLGYPVGACRKPFDALSDEGMNVLRKVLADAAGKGVC
ncbi:MAG: 4-hydroxy-tetrahydrodipicolinate synthase [Eubacteriales bacterium]|nr:4-hydroxy-tetrahydrodipicolinate synthase [Eubacteriales bacterium]